MRGAARCADLLVRRLPERDRELRRRGLHRRPPGGVQALRDRAVLIAYDRDEAGEKARGRGCGAAGADRDGLLPGAVSAGHGRERVRVEVKPAEKGLEVLLVVRLGWEVRRDASRRAPLLLVAAAKRKNRRSPKRSRVASSATSTAAERRARAESAPKGADRGAVVSATSTPTSRSDKTRSRETAAPRAVPAMPLPSSPATSSSSRSATGRTGREVSRRC